MRVGASATMIAPITATTSSNRQRSISPRPLANAWVGARVRRSSDHRRNSDWLDWLRSEQGAHVSAQRARRAHPAPTRPRPSLGANRPAACRVRAAAPHRPPSPSARRTRSHRRWTSRRAGRGPASAVATRPHCTTPPPCGQVGDRARRAVRARARLLAAARESASAHSPSAANRSARLRWSSALISSRPKIESAACGVRRRGPTRRITSTATSTPIAMMRTAPVACPGA